MSELREPRPHPDGRGDAIPEGAIPEPTIPEPEVTPRPISGRDLITALQCARNRTLELVEDLSSAQLSVPHMETVNPPIWELGHVAWFHERWSLRVLFGEALDRPHVDELYNSAEVVHDSRWSLRMPTLEGTLDYLERVSQRLYERLDSRDPDSRETYYHLLGLYHEDMHAEAFTYTRQTFEYPAPQFACLPAEGAVCGDLPTEDIEIPGGTYLIGTRRDTEHFVWDNEKWQHPATLAPFRIAAITVTEEQFAAFVDDGGYGCRQWWSDDGWRWREQQGTDEPLYWRRDGGGWQKRRFDVWRALQPDHPMMHVNAHEADAWCRWAGRRLPTEAEWEVAAAYGSKPEASAAARRRYPWGDERPDQLCANLDGCAGDCVSVGALPGSASASGCRHLLGNVWEWTASFFEPYEGFRPDAYQEYSSPWFGDHRVLRGGCWLTRSRMIHNGYRNFYRPYRNDVWAGFRTCALDIG